MDVDLLNLTRKAQMVPMEKLAAEYPQQTPSPPSVFDLLGTSDAYNNSAADLSFGVDPALQPVAAMREMIFRVAAMQPVHIDPESVKPPKRRNVKISKDPQSVAARRRRERISERIRILQRLVPGGTKMDTASMLDEAIHYVKFLKTQVQSLERAAATGAGFGFSSGSELMADGNNNNNNYSCFGHAYTNVELSQCAFNSL